MKRRRCMYIFKKLGLYILANSRCVPMGPLKVHTLHGTDRATDWVSELGFLSWLLYCSWYTSYRREQHWYAACMSSRIVYRLYLSTPTGLLPIRRGLYIHSPCTVVGADTQLFKLWCKATWSYSLAKFQPDINPTIWLYIYQRLPKCLETSTYSITPQNSQLITKGTFMKSLHIQSTILC